MGEELIPGRVLLKNINRGIDPDDSRYQLLENVDGNFKFRCRRELDDLKRTGDKFEFESGKILDTIFNMEFYLPAVVSPDAKETYLLAPDLWKHIAPGMAAPCLEAKKSISLKSGKFIYLSHSKIFHNKGVENIGSDRSRNYAMTVHDINGVDPFEGCYQALIFQLGLKKDYKGHPMDIRYIDSYFLGNYGEELSKRNGGEIIEFIEKYGREIWFFNANKIPQSKFKVISKDLGQHTRRETNFGSPPEKDRQKEEYFNKDSRSR